MSKYQIALHPSYTESVNRHLQGENELKRKILWICNKNNNLA